VLASQPDQLVDAIGGIVSEVAVPACTYDLARPVDDHRLLAVFFDDEAVPYDETAAAGWSYDPAANAISFHGAACDALHRGDVAEVRVEFGCAGPVVL
jgi:hypothetical protein